MSDNFIFPDDADGFPPDGPSPDGFSFQDSGSPAFGGPDAEPTFDAPDFDAPGFGAPGFGAPGFGAPADGGPEFGGPEFGAAEFGTLDFGAADAASPGDPDLGSDEGLVDQGVFLGGSAFGEVPLDTDDLGVDPSWGGAPGDGAVAVSFAEADEVVPEAPVGGPKGRDKKPPKRSRSKDGLVLGIHVTPKQVYGVLVRPSADGYEPLRQFVRNRAESQYGHTALSPDDVALEEATVAVGADDPSVQFGGSGEIDFSAEFAGMGVVTDAAFDTTATAGDVDQLAQPIIFELRDILEECAQAGFARPVVAFTIDAPDVAYAELAVPPEKKAKKAKKAKKGAPAAGARRAQGDGLDAGQARPAARAAARLRPAPSTRAAWRSSR